MATTVTTNDDGHDAFSYRTFAVDRIVSRADTVAPRASRAGAASILRIPDDIDGDSVAASAASLPSEF